MLFLSTSFLIVFQTKGQIFTGYSIGSINNNTAAFSLPSINGNYIGGGGGGKSTNVDVDLYSGSLQVSLPLFSMESKALNLPTLSLSYGAGKGVKIQDFASYVGMGWRINGSGYISRQVRGYPDETANGYDKTASKILPKVNSTTRSITIKMPDDKNFLGANFSDYPTDDGEPDLFFITTPFFSASFIFGEGGLPIFQRASGLQIKTHGFLSHGNGSGGDGYYSNSWFEVTDDNGNIYFFGNDARSIEKTASKRDNQYLSVISTWYLTKIESFNKTEAVTYTYVNDVSNFNIPLNYYGRTEVYIPNCDFGNTSRITQKQTQEIVISSPVYLTKIETNLSLIELSYTWDRSDIPHAGRLFKVTKKAYDPKTKRKDANPQTLIFLHQYISHRLNLSKINLATADPDIFLTQYAFTYDQSKEMPEGASESKDFWGYFNAISDYGDDPYDISNCVSLRKADYDFAKTNILVGIFTPSGLTWQINYELNRGYLPNNDFVIGGGLRVNKLTKKVPTGEEFSEIYDYTDESGNQSGKIYSDKFKNIVQQFNQYETFVFSENPIFSNDLNGIFVGYATVSVIHPDKSFSRFKFSTFSDFPDDICRACTNLEPISFAYKRGLLLNESIFDSQSKKVSEKIMEYKNFLGSTQYAGWSIKTRVVGSYSIRCPYTCLNVFGLPILTCHYGISASDKTYQAFYYQVEDYRMWRTTERLYDQLDGSRFNEKVTDYEYFRSKIKTVETSDSKGNIQKKQYFYIGMYPTDLSSMMVPQGSTEETNMKNLYNLKNISYNQYKSILVHEIAYFNNKVVEQKHYLHETFNYNNNQLVLCTKTTTYKGDGASVVLMDEKKFEVDLPTGNLKTITDKNNKKASFLYGYNNSLQIASALNASQEEIFYESFEENPLSTNGSSHSGCNYFVDYTTSFVPPNSKNYIIQWWEKTNNEWVFNEKKYIYDVNNPIILTGIIDDVRIYPTDAVLTTTTYRLPYGKSSEIEERGKCLLYNYDALGRLESVLDGKMNYIKKYAYDRPNSDDFIFRYIYARIEIGVSPSCGCSECSGNSICFYSDVNCTIPLSVSNLRIDYTKETVCQLSGMSPSCGNACDGVNNGYYGYVIANGSKVYIGDGCSYTQSCQDQGDSFSSWEEYHLTKSEVNVIFRPTY